MKLRVFRDVYGYEYLGVVLPRDERETCWKCRFRRGGNSLLPVWEWLREQYLAQTGRRILPRGGATVEVEELILLRLLEGARRGSRAAELRELVLRLLERGG